MPQRPAAFRGCVNLAKTFQVQYQIGKFGEFSKERPSLAILRNRCYGAVIRIGTDFLRLAIFLRLVQKKIIQFRKFYLNTFLRSVRVFRFQFSAVQKFRIFSAVFSPHFSAFSSVHFSKFELSQFGSDF